MSGRRLRSEVLINVGFSAANAVGILFASAIASLVFAPPVLDVVLLGRRLAAAAANLTQLGVSQTLQRYLSVHAADGPRKLVYLQYGLAIVVLSGGAIVTGVWLVGGELSDLIFPSMSNAKSYCFWLGVTIASTAAGFLSASLLLAERRMWGSGVLQMLNIHGFFLIALWWFGRHCGVVELFRFTALCSLGISLTVAVIYWTVWRRRVPSPDPSTHRMVRGDFLRFGIPRTFIAFLDAGVLLIGPWLLRHQPGQTAAFILALTVVRVVQAGLAPISQVIGLGVARMLGRSQEDGMRRQSRHLFGGLVYLGVLVPCLLEPWHEILVRVWLPDATLANDVCGYLSILLWGMTPLALFYGLRGPVDMRWTSPYNLFALLTSFCVQLLTFYVLQSHFVAPLAVAFAALAGFWTVGCMTVFWIRRDLPSWREMGLGHLIPLAIAIWAINTWLSRSAGVLHVAIGMLIFLGGIAVSWRFWPPEFVLAQKKLWSLKRQETFCAANGSNKDALQGSAKEAHA